MGQALYNLWRFYSWKKRDADTDFRSGFTSSAWSLLPFLVCMRRTYKCSQVNYIVLFTCSEVDEPRKGGVGECCLPAGED